MEEQTIRQIQREGAEALLNTGVSVPLVAVRIPFRREPLRLRVTMKRPTLAGQLEIARTYLAMNTTSEALEGMTTEQQMGFLAEHGKRLSRLIALTICTGCLARKFLTPAMSWIVRNLMSYEYQMTAVTQFVKLMGTDPFLPIIRSAEITNPMKLRLSHKRKGS
nr:MAG TPA: hypothetical protein [Caudoviricetes sp.]